MPMFFKKKDKKKDDQQDLQKILEKEEQPTRNLSGFWKYLIYGLSVILVLMYFFAAGVRPFNFEIERGVYVLLTYVIILLYYPFYAKNEGIAHSIISRIPQPLRKIFFNRNHPGLFDIILAILATVGVGYWILEFNNIGGRVGAYNKTDYLMAIITVLIGLEIARRMLGWSMTLIGVFFLLYPVYGYLFPEPFNHGGHLWEDTMTYFYFSPDGTFGIMVNVLVTYVILFIFFGAFLRKSGASRFFMDFPLALAGRTIGGPAKVAVLASGFFGSISGSAIANTVSTGTFTIPLMKRAGFKPHVAGAIEPTASIGGMFMPPIMGAGGFLMAELTEIQYAEIMLISLFPAVIYFFSVFVQIHLQAKKDKLVGIEDMEIRKPWDVFKEQWYLSTPLIIIVVLMLIGRSPGFAAFWATASTIVISWFNKEYRMGPKKIFEAIVEGAKGTLIIGATIGVIGIIISSISITGIDLKFSYILVKLSQGNVALMILLIGLASLVLGMGVPVTAAYLIVVVLAAPPLVEMGVVLIAAHQIVYWFSQDSNITPPVCVAAYAGAAIAGSDPWKTGWTAFKFAKMLYVMPFLFAFTPAILLQGSTTEIITSFVTATLGTIGFGSVTIGYLVRKTTWPEWILLAMGTVLTYIPYLPYYPIGIAIYAAVYFYQKMTENKKVKGAIE